MGLTEKQLIEQSLYESKDFVKEIRQYLYDVSKERPLTEREQKFWDDTHNIHIHTNDAILLMNTLENFCENQLSKEDADLDR